MIRLQMLSRYYICKIMVIIACSLIRAGVTSFKDVCMISAGLGSFLSGCLMQLAIHNHLLLSLPATTVTILWLK